MSKHEITAPEAVTGWTNGRKLTLDPIKVYPITVEIREVESTIPCGFQVAFGTVDIDGDDLDAFAGAGFGSQWITMRFRDKSYCFPITEVIGSFLDQLKEEGQRIIEDPTPEEVEEVRLRLEANP